MKTNNQTIQIPVDSVALEGILAVPSDAKGIVIFVHGSGSSRLSPRNSFVAEILQQAGFATLLFDLLTAEEDSNYNNRFDIALLVERLKIVTKWVTKQSTTKNLKIGYFGASTGAAAAIIAAADLRKEIKAIVSRGGRPDLAEQALDKVKAPVLLIVGGNDDVVIRLNEQANNRLTCEKHMSIVSGATHLFEEPGALEEVAKQSSMWFTKYL